MNMVTKLPEFDRTLAGLKQALIRQLPLLAFAGTTATMLWLLVMPVAARWSGRGTAARLAMTIEIALASVLVLYWTLVLAMALGCVIVMIARGPGYVADAFPVPNADAPLRGLASVQLFARSAMTIRRRFVLAISAAALALAAARAQWATRRARAGPWAASS